MGYYRGDYYRGDYYRGDPGIFGSIGKFLGGVVKTVGSVAKVAGGILPGPVGTALSVVGRIAAPTARAPVGMSIAPSTGGLGPMLPSLPPIGVGQLGPIGTQTGGLINVQTFTQGGRPIVKQLDTATGQFVKKRRRMNVTNVKALRRAIRRSRGFIKIARKTVGVFGLSVQRRGGKRAVARRR